MTRRGGVLAAVALAAGFVFGQPLLSVLPWQITLAAVCALVAAVMAGHYLRTGATIDFDGIELPVWRWVCDLELCSQPSAVEFEVGLDSHDGRLFICAQHAAQVSQWAPVAAVRMPFDQEAS